MWFLKEYPSGQAVLVEPDPEYLEIGKANFARNGLEGLFINAFVSSTNDPEALFLCESTQKKAKVPSLTFSQILKVAGIESVDIALIDIQGAEISFLEDLPNALANCNLRFLFVSTHDLAISGSAITHQDSVRILENAGAFIIAEHSVSESFSGDGFILASFNPADKNIAIDLSYNRSKNSLFGVWEERFQKMIDKVTSLELENAGFELKLHSYSEVFLENENNKRTVFELVNSKSWRVTQPLRSLNKVIKKLFNYRLYL